jgi:hypothetical protein
VHLWYDFALRSESDECACAYSHFASLAGPFRVAAHGHQFCENAKQGGSWVCHFLMSARALISRFASLTGPFRVAAHGLNFVKTRSANAEANSNWPCDGTWKGPASGAKREGTPEQSMASDRYAKSYRRGTGLDLCPALHRGHDLATRDEAQGGRRGRAEGPPPDRSLVALRK